MLVHPFQIILNFLYVCQFAGWLTSLLKIDKYRYIWSSGWDIFMNFFGDISGMLVHYFHIILNFLYVCQSVSWLTSLLKLHKFRDISSSRWYIFLEFLETLLGCWYTISKYFWISHTSVSLFVCLLSCQN